MCEHEQKIRKEEENKNMERKETVEKWKERNRGKNGRRMA